MLLFSIFPLDFWFLSTVRYYHISFKRTKIFNVPVLVAVVNCISRYNAMLFSTTVKNVWTKHIFLSTTISKWLHNSIYFFFKFFRHLTKKDKTTYYHTHNILSYNSLTILFISLNNNLKQILPVINTLEVSWYTCDVFLLCKKTISNICLTSSQNCQGSVYCNVIIFSFIVETA